jgi:HlyD family secretion protein
MNDKHPTPLSIPDTPAERAYRPHWQWLVWALAGLGAATGLWWAFAPRPVNVDLAAVTVGLFEQSIEEDGQLSLKQRYLVTAPLAGHLQRSDLQVGDPVQAHQTVAWLAPVTSPMIDPRQQTVLRQRVGRDQATQEAASARVQQLQTALDQARLQTQRTAQLAQQNFMAQAALDQAQLSERAAEQALQAGLAELLATRFSLAESQAALHPSAATPAPPAPATRPDLLAITSPVNGQVLQIHQSSAGPVTAGQALLTLGDLRSLEAVIDVLSADARQIPVGAPVSLSLSAQDVPLQGHVRHIEPIAFTKISALGIEEQRVNVRVDLLPTPEASAPGLGDGFRVDARIVSARTEQALRVPTAALVRDGSQWRVWLFDQGRARARQVVLKDRNAEHAWIETGTLQAGNQVVLYPAPLREGQRIQKRSP